MMLECATVTVRKAGTIKTKIELIGIAAIRMVGNGEIVAIE